MINIARWHTLCGLVLAIAGMGLGIYMAASHDHGQHVTHAHLLLLGFVVSVLYGLIYRIWIPGEATRLAWLQLALHQAGTVTMVIGLFLLYQDPQEGASVEPVLGLASIAVLTALVMMAVIFVRSTRSVLSGQPEAAARRVMPG